MTRCESPLLKEVDRAIFSEMHRRSVEARSEGERGEREGEEMEREETRTACKCCTGICIFLKALSPCCLAIVLTFCEAVPNALLLLEQRGHATHYFTGIKSI